jgi:ribosomal protein L29
MDFKELKTKSANDLQKMLKLHREELRSLRFKVASGQFKNVREMRKVKNTIARILTLLSGNKK